MAMFVYFTFGDWRAHFPGRRGDLQRNGVPLSIPLKGHPSFNLWPHSVLLLGRKHWEGELSMRSGTTWWICFENKTGPCKIMEYLLTKSLQITCFFLLVIVLKRFSKNITSNFK